RWSGACAAAFVCGGMLGGAPAGAQSLQSTPPEVQQAWRATGLPESALSLVVRELGGAGLASVNAGIPRNPASVMKVVTTWAALSGLGPQYRWRTAFYTDRNARI